MSHSTKRKKPTNFSLTEMESLAECRITLIDPREEGLVETKSF